MTKVVWLPSETDYSYCEFVAPNTPYSPRLLSRRSNRQTRPPERFGSSLYMFHGTERYPERVLHRVEAIKCVVKAILGGLDNK